VNVLRYKSVRELYFSKHTKLVKAITIIEQTS